MDYGLDFRLDSIQISCQLHSVHSFTACYVLFGFTSHDCQPWERSKVMCILISKNVTIQWLVLPLIDCTTMAL